MRLSAVGGIRVGGIRGLAALLVAFVLLAGCSDGAKPMPDGTREEENGVAADVQPEGGFQDVGTTASTGGVTGVIVDEAIRPVKGAAVQLVQASKDQLSDEDGLFSFAGLQPGAYTLKVAAAGMLDVTQTVTVQAKTVTKVKVVLLAVNGTTAPFHTTYAFKGFIEASAGLATWSLELFAQEYTNSTICRCTFFMTMDEPPVDIVYEAAWTETVDDPTDFGFYWELLTWEDANVTADASASPVYAVIPGSNYPPGQLQYKARLTGPWTFPAVQQSYDLFVTAFYRGHAPDGWSLVNGDT